MKRCSLSSQFYFLILLIFSVSCESPTKVSPWDVVDSNSILILESKFVPKFSDKTCKPFLIKSADMYVSTVQKSSKNSFDILYSYLVEKETFDSLLKSKFGLINHKITSRLLNAIDIYELKNDQNIIQVTFAYLNGVFVLSKSSLLIENAIRVFHDQQNRNFRLVNPELFQFPSIKSDQGNIYVNIEGPFDFPITESSLLKSIPLLKDLRNVSIYDIKSNNEFLSLSGFSLAKNSSLSRFQEQKPVVFEVAKYIPNSSHTLAHFGISDIHLFKNVLDSSFFKKSEIGDEIAFITTSSDRLIAIIEIISSSTSKMNFITDYSESYSNYQIQSVDGGLLKRGFGKLFPSEDFTFCFVKDSYLFLSHSVDELKSLIDAIENDDTWGKTLDYQKFSEKGLHESNLTLIFKKPAMFSETINAFRGYEGMIDSLDIDNIDWYSVQMSALDNHFYSSINLGLGSTNVRSEVKEKNKSSSVELPGNIQFASLAVNHNNGLQEILIQDSNLILYLISLTDGILWRKQLDTRIHGSLEQIDYYKNGKLQYFFCTEDKIFIVDRLGRDVAEFPKLIPDQIEFYDLVDYDKSKNYRFLVSSTNKEIYLLDKDGANLNEWGPKKFNETISNPPQHIKIGGKDHFFVSLSNGVIQIFNRKGDRVSTFESKSKELWSGDYGIESGESYATTYFYYVSSTGAFVKQNLKGEIIKEEDLVRGRNSKFFLSRMVSDHGFHIYRIDTDKVVILNKDGSLMFEIPNSGSMNLKVQSSKAKNGKLVFSFFDMDQKLTQVFDESGRSLLQTPIECDRPPIFGFGKTKKEFGLFTFQQNIVVFNPIQ